MAVTVVNHTLFRLKDSVRGRYFVPHEVLASMSIKGSLPKDFEGDPYLLQLVRYIHLNPIRAGIVRDLRGLNPYPYSGHAVLLGRYKRPWRDRAIS